MGDLTHVLIVDDDFDIRDALSDALSDLGFRVTTAEDGAVALDYLRAHPPPQVILLDWMMPRCDGASFRAAQCSDPKLASIPVVVLTADPKIRSRAHELGVAGFMQKPVDLGALVEMLRAHA